MRTDMTKQIVAFRNYAKAPNRDALVKSLNYGDVNV
jgi:hypothetical protein